MPFEAVLFDKDGTLFAFEASWAGWMAGVIDELSEGDAALADRLAGTFGFDRDGRRFHHDSPVIAGTLGEVVPLVSPLLPGIGPEDLSQRLGASAGQVAMVPAVPLQPLLAELRDAGYVLGVATNATGEEAMAHLEAAGVVEAFGFIAGCDAGYGAKPDPGQCLAFADHVGVAPDMIVMVGDSLHDLRAGRAAGMRTVGVLTGVASAGDLAPFADVVLPDIGALPHWLRAAG
jgi:phosphoglycolate phosphatase